MRGAKDYCRIFKRSEQVGKLYIVIREHARGNTFRIYILPKGETVIPNGPSNPPLNKNRLEVYGITSGQPGWDEVYGWLYEGKWQADFDQAVIDKITAMHQDAIIQDERMTNSKKTEEKRIENLLNSY